MSATALYENAKRAARTTPAEQYQSTILFALCLCYCADARKITIGDTPYPNFQQAKTYAKQLYEIVRNEGFEPESADAVFCYELQTLGDHSSRQNLNHLAEKIGQTEKEASELYDLLSNDIDHFLA